MNSSRATMRLAMLLAIVAATGLAGEPWKEKSFREWDQKDLARIMQDSPWSKNVYVPITWREGRARGLTPDTSASSGAPTSIRGTRDASEFGGVEGRTVTARGEPTALFTVRWTSSLTLRQAVARLNFLRGLPAAEAEKPLAFDPPVHELIIFGEDLSLFEKATEQELKQKTHLSLKQARKEVQPLAVALRKSEDGKRTVAVVFHFPKKTDSGEALIAASEKSIEFHVHAAGTSFKVEFEPRKMVTKEGPEF